MSNNFASRVGRNLTNSVAIGALALGFSLNATPASAQQSQQPQDQQQPQQQDQQQPATQQQQDQQQQQQDQMNQQQDQGPSQDQPPPDDRDRGPMPPAEPRQDAQQPPPPDNNYVVPDTLTLSSGAILQVRTTGWLSSDRNKAGDQVIMTLAQPLVVNGLVVARRGQTVIGTVVNAERAGRVKGVSKLGLGLTQLTLVDGQLLDVKSTLINASGGTSNGRDAASHRRNHRPGRGHRRCSSRRAGSSDRRGRWIRCQRRRRAHHARAANDYSSGIFADVQTRNPDYGFYRARTDGLQTSHFARLRSEAATQTGCAPLLSISVPISAATLRLRLPVSLCVPVQILPMIR